MVIILGVMSFWAIILKMLIAFLALLGWHIVI